jgi:hypothetical protein
MWEGLLFRPRSRQLQNRDSCWTWESGWFKLATLPMNTIELLLSFGSVTLQALLLIILLLKDIQRRFRWFLAYLATNFLFGAALLLMFWLSSNQGLAYSVIYWTGDALVTSLAIMACYDIFRVIFLNFFKLRGFRVVFPAASILLVLIGSIRALANSGPTLNGNFLISQIFSLEIVGGILQVGIFFLFLVLVQFFRVPWKQYTFGIALGFGVSAAGSLVAFIVRSEFGTKFDPIFRFVVPLTYTIGVAIWLLTFLWPVPKAQLEATAPALTPEAVVTELKQYTRTVKEILKR